MLTRQSSASVVTALAVLVAVVIAPFVAVSATSGWVTANPDRVLDTRRGQTTSDGQYASIGTRPAGSTLQLQLTGRAGIPTDANTVLLNITTTNPAAAGFVTVHPCDTTRPNASNVNYTPGTTQANLAVARLDHRGRTCIYTHANTDIIADVQAYTTNGIDATDPDRVLDTRRGQTTSDGQYASIGTRPAGSTLQLQLTGRAGIPTDANTVLLNITTTNPAAAGFVTVHPCDTTRPNASNVNYTPGTTQANLAVARLDHRGRTCIYTHANTDIIADVQAYTTNGIDATDPDRVLDTRRGQTTSDGQYASIGTRPAGSTLQLQLTGRAGIPTDANTVLLNITTTNPAAAGFVTVHPCDTTRPNASNVNYTPGTTQANLAVARLDHRGRTCIYTHANTDIIADVQGHVVNATIMPPTTVAPTTVPAPPLPEGESGFVHPGVLMDRAHLDELRQDVAAGEQSVTAAFNVVNGPAGSTATELRPRTYAFSSLSYVPAPVPVVQAGGNETYLASHGLENIGGQEHIDDAKAAYTHALLWYITDNQAHADKAIEIMNAWSTTLTEIKFDDPARVDNGWPVFVQGKLQAGWGGSLFSRAAEIIRYSGAGWSNSDITRFETMLHDIYLPLVESGWTNGANWLMTFAEATISIGVFTNDHDAFDTGIAMFRDKAPTTIYHHTDGAHPIPSASYLNTPEKIRNNWRNPNYYPTGLQQETLYDLGHMTMGLGALANAAETAYIQGIDLYTEHADRIIAGNELNASYVNDYLDEVARRGGQQPTSTWTPTNWPGDPGTFDIGNNFYRSGWLVAHHHYTTRTSTPMPETTHLVQRLGTNATQPAIHLCWETLTHTP